MPVLSLEETLGIVQQSKIRRMRKSFAMRTIQLSAPQKFSVVDTSGTSDVLSVIIHGASPQGETVLRSQLISLIHGRNALMGNNVPYMSVQCSKWRPQRPHRPAKFIRDGDISRIYGDIFKNRMSKSDCKYTYILILNRISIRQYMHKLYKAT